MESEIGTLAVGGSNRRMMTNSLDEKSEIVTDNFIGLSK